MKPCPFCRAAVTDDVVFAPGAPFCGACGRSADQVRQSPSLPPGASPFAGPPPGPASYGGPPPPGPQVQWPPMGGPQPGPQQPWPSPGGPQVGGQQPWPPPGGPQVGPQQPWPPQGAQMGGGAQAWSPPGLNWGGFLLPFIWGPANSVWIGLLGLAVLIPYVGWMVCLGVGVYLLVKGNELAWRSGRAWQSVEQFHAVQKAWTMWGLVVTGISIVLGILVYGAMYIQATQGGQYVPVQ